MFRINSYTVIALVSLVLFWVQPAIAAEQTLEFKLATRAVEPKAIEVPNVAGQVVFMHKFYDTAFFKDGGVAAKAFFAGDFNKGNGPLCGHSSDHRVISTAS